MPVSDRRMTRARLQQLQTVYRDGLLDDVVPFWTRHGVDREHGGIMTCLDRDGSVIDTDKGMWQQGRFAWLMATLYRTVESRFEWREVAQRTVDFIRAHGFDRDGRMFFQVTREGAPLRKRRYFYAEAFAAMGMAALGRITGDEVLAGESRDVFGRFLRLARMPELLEPKYVPGSRETRTLGISMIALNVAQVLRETIGDERCDREIERSITEIEEYFVKPEYGAVLETAGRNGEVLDHFEGRTLNPGHAIEAAWFILHEARHRGGDRRLVSLGTTMLDWMWDRGWDRVHGGLFYFCDLRDLPVQEYWHDMKFWWPHCEAIIATLLAWELTGDRKYARWHEQVHDWSHTHFPDREHGEWYGYLHRDGTPSVRLKGNLWKGCYHLPRMQWYCWQLVADVLAGRRPAGAPPADAR